MMNFLLDKRGNISVFRVSMAVVAFGAIVILFGFILFQFEQSSRRVPLDIQAPPNAQPYGAVPDPNGIAERQIFYRVPGGDTEHVAAFYADLLDNFPDNQPDSFGSKEQCQRNPPVGQFPDYEPGSGNVPFSWKCLFERSSFNSLQYTLVTIQPGIPENETEGDVIIIYEQRWQP